MAASSFDQNTLLGTISASLEKLVQAHRAGEDYKSEVALQALQSATAGLAVIATPEDFAKVFSTVIDAILQEPEHGGKGSDVSRNVQDAFSLIKHQIRKSEVIHPVVAEKFFEIAGSRIPKDPRLMNPTQDAISCLRMLGFTAKPNGKDALPYSERIRAIMSDRLEPMLDSIDNLHIRGNLAFAALAIPGSASDMRVGEPVQDDEITLMQERRQDIYAYRERILATMLKSIDAMPLEKKAYFLASAISTGNPEGSVVLGARAQLEGLISESEDTFLLAGLVRATRRSGKTDAVVDGQVASRVETILKNMKPLECIRKGFNLIGNGYSGALTGSSLSGRTVEATILKACGQVDSLEDALPTLNAVRVKLGNLVSRHFDESSRTVLPEAKAAESLLGRSAQAVSLREQDVSAAKVSIEQFLGKHQAPHSG